MGKLKFIILIFLPFTHLYSFSVSSLFENSSTIFLKNYLLSLPSKSLYHQVKAQTLDKYNFDTKPFMKLKDINDNINFWFKTYSLYRLENIVLHDKEDLSQIYTVLDFSPLKKIIPNIVDRLYLQNEILLHYIKLHKKKYKNSFNIRGQTGRRDSIEKGLKLFASYQNYLEKLCTLFNLPKEILALALLESTFNPHAQSIVNAQGIWQFMPAIGQHFMLQNQKINQFISPILSTLAAMHLIVENKKILNSDWGLTITSYNTGTTVILNSLKKLPKKDFHFKNFIRHNHQSTIGFASKNFYAAFLSLVLVYKNLDKLFPEHHKHNIDYSLYQLTETSNFSETLRPFESIYLNNHLLDKNNISKGSLIILPKDVKVNQSYLKEIPFPLLKTRYPKNLKLI